MITKNFDLQEYYKDKLQDRVNDLVAELTNHGFPVFMIVGLCRENGSEANHVMIIQGDAAGGHATPEIAKHVAVAEANEPNELFDLSLRFAKFAMSMASSGVESNVSKKEDLTDEFKARYKTKH
jgi:hypothetical protein